MHGLFERVSLFILVACVVASLRADDFDDPSNSEYEIGETQDSIETSC